MPVVDDELRQINSRLSRRIERHAIELKAAQSAMDNLARTISHDLRSPLTVIGGFAELLLKHSGQDLDAKGRHYLQTIATSTFQVGRILDEILALSRMSQSEMHHVRIDLETLVRRVMRELEAVKGERLIEWQIGPLPMVYADPLLLHEAIANLAFNALRFTSSLEVARIQIGAQKGDHELIFFVRDNGGGFDLKHRERMFGIFQNAPTLSEIEGGAIGLAYVQRIIQRHGGRSWTEAVTGGGGTFYFSLPDDGAETHLRLEEA